MDMVKKAVGLGGGGPQIHAQVGKEANKQVIAGDQRKNEIETEGGDVTLSSDTSNTAIQGGVDTEAFIVNNMPSPKILAWIAFGIFLLGYIFPSPFETIRRMRQQYIKIRNLK
jgi:hypothetical protein